MLGGLEVWIGTPGGGFYLETSDEFDGIGRAFDIQIDDMNGDGLGDIVACFAPADDKPGGVRLWLSAERDD
mgnify:CR=1 FL=1